MDPAQRLQQRDRRLSADGANQPPRAVDPADLQCQDPATVEHWVRVYTELVEFVRGLIDSPSIEEPPREGRAAPNGLSRIGLQARLLELHLAYWTDRLDRLHTDPGTGKD